MIVSGITDKCNQRCPFCFRHTDPSYTLSDGTVFTRDNILTFAAEVAESGTAGIRLCGEGEDTLHKDYLDFLLLLRAAGVNILQITNGTTAEWTPAGDAIVVCLLPITATHPADAN